MVPLRLAGLLVLVAVVAGFDGRTPRAGGPGSSAETPAGEERIVIRVIDGDTLELDGRERVRLIGIDTPETHEASSERVRFFGEAAKRFVRDLVAGKSVRLGFEHGGPRRDRYGRTLAFVFLQDGRLLNLEILRAGYGFAYLRFPFSRSEEFRATEAEARAADRGLWAEQMEQGRRRRRR